MWRAALPVVDRPGLVAVLVDGQHDAAVQQLLVDVDRRGRQEDRHRARRPCRSWVTSRPVELSLPVDAIDSSPSDCRSFNA